MAIVYFILGIISLLYFLFICIVGHGSNFFFIWAIMGCFFLLLFLLQYKGILQQLPLQIRNVGFIFVGVLLLVFFIVEGMIFCKFTNHGEPNLDYLIVLGAQMKHNGPSRVLKQRLDTACVYLKENSGTIVIVSGAKGKDEPVSEAQGMKDYLAGHGIEETRIIMENQSLNTYQNIRNCKNFVDTTKNKIGIVTSDFHVFRAFHLARKAGYKDLHMIAAPSEAYMLPNNMTREFFGIIKDGLMGSLQ